MHAFRLKTSKFLFFLQCSKSPRNDVDEVSEVLEPGNVSPTYSKVESSTGAQVVYLLVVYALISVLISAIVLVCKNPMIPFFLIEKILMFHFFAKCTNI